MPKISVIVPNYNHAKYLKQRIDSILSQTYKDYELILLDDCSTDNSQIIIDEYTNRFPGIKSYYNNTNSGNPFKQWDYGVQKAKGDFIWIAESDDFAEPDFLKETLPIIANNENVGLVYCNSKIINEIDNTEYYATELKPKLHKNRWFHNYINNGIKEISDYLFLNNTINNVSGVLFNRNTYIEAGKADHTMRYCGDWFMYLRILQISDVAYIAKPLNIIRLHSGSTFHDYFIKSSYLREVIRIYIFLLKNFNPTTKKKLHMLKNLIRITFKRIF